MSSLPAESQGPRGDILLAPAQSADRAVPVTARRKLGFGTWLSIGWLLIVVFGAAFAALLPIAGPNAVDVSATAQGPSLHHLLGTDELGRDIFSRLIYGARTSLMVGFAVVLIGGTVGTLIGAIAAYAGRWTEEALMRVTDLMFCFPPVILAMAIAAALGIGTRNTVIAMLVVWWPKFAR